MKEKESFPEYPGWRTVRRLGSGSYGAVYEIERDLFGKKESAALKQISIPQSESEVDELFSSGYDSAAVAAHYEGCLSDIVREYSLMTEIRGNTNVVNCEDVRYERHPDGYGWDIFIRMELLTPLMKVLGSSTEEAQIVKLGRDIANALVLCESRNIVHRDIKPQNIFVSKDGNYKLGDFGIAKTMEKTSSGTKVGTFNYMAPEVFSVLPYGHPADIYSLGLVLYWLLNERRLPFLPLPPAVPTAAEQEEALMRRFRGEPLPAPAHGSEELRRIVLKACAFYQQDRYLSAAELLRDLSALDASARGDRAASARRGATGDASGAWDRESSLPDGDETVVLGRETRPLPSAEGDATTVLSGAEAESPYGAAVRTSGEETTVLRQRGDAPGEERTAEKQEDAPYSGERGKRKGSYRIWILLAAVVVSAIVGFFTIHIWTPATCTEAETCKICRKTRTPALGHRWKAASCTEPQTCTVCGATGDPALGHNWIEATYETPKTCIRCGAQEGKVKGYYGTEEGYYSDEWVSLPTFTNWIIHPYVLNHPISNCRNMDFTLAFTYSSGDPFGNWEFFIRDESNTWISVGTYNVQDTVTTVHVFFDHPVTVTAVGADRLSNNPCDMSFGYTLTDIQQYEMDIPSDAVGVKENGVLHYFYVYEVDSSFSWSDAAAYCESKGGHLATLTSSAQNEAAYKAMTQKSGGACVYFGLSDDSAEGTWTWITGEPYSYSCWQQGEPNGAANENFGAFYDGTGTAKWVDADFKEQSSKPVICEWDVKNA